MQRILVRGRILLASVLTCGVALGASWIMPVPAYGVVDTTPPVTSAPDLPRGWQLEPFTVTLTATDTESGVRDTFYSIGQPLEYTTTTYTAPFAITRPGSAYINCRSWDWAGNIEQFKHFLVQLDLAAPVTTSDAKPAYLETATIRLSATDDASGIRATRYSIDNGPTAVGSVVTPTGWGTHTLRFSSSDVAGRTEATKSVDFELAVAMREVAGADRLDTSIAISQQAYPKGAQAVIVCSARAWPDALASSGLGGCMDAPILLSEPSGASPALLAEIARLKPNRVVLIGGRSALSDSVSAAIAQALPSAAMERIEGADRYATSLAIFERIMTYGAYEYSGEPYVVTGGSFADGCAVAQMARLGWVPILYVRPGTGAVPSELADAIKRTQCFGIKIVGGPDAVSPQTEASLRAIGGSHGMPLPVSRIGGVDRYATSVALARQARTTTGLTFVTGRDFPDALCASSYASKVAGGRIVLIPGDGLGPAQELLTERKATIMRLAWIGGERSITRATRDRAAAILGTPYRVTK